MGRPIRQQPAVTNRGNGVFRYTFSDQERADHDTVNDTVTVAQVRDYDAAGNPLRNVQNQILLGTATLGPSDWAAVPTNQFDVPGRGIVTLFIGGWINDSTEIGAVAVPNKVLWALKKGARNARLQR